MLSSLFCIDPSGDHEGMQRGILGFLPPKKIVFWRHQKRTGSEAEELVSFGGTTSAFTNGEILSDSVMIGFLCLCA